MISTRRSKAATPALHRSKDLKVVRSYWTGSNDNRRLALLPWLDQKPTRLDMAVQEHISLTRPMEILLTHSQMMNMYVVFIPSALRLDMQERLDESRIHKKQIYTGVPGGPVLIQFYYDLYITWWSSLARWMRHSWLRWKRPRYTHQVQYDGRSSVRHVYGMCLFGIVHER
jgi:hypothetical protein